MEIKFRHELGLLMGHFGLVGKSVEIGVAEGRFSEIMVSWPWVTKHYMIDSWKHLNQKGDGHQPQAWHDYNLQETLRRTEQYQHKCIILQGLSGEMIPQIPDDSISLAYIDGDHSLQGCLNDLDALWSKIKVGGIISGHDYLNPAYGVGQAVKIFFLERFATIGYNPTNKLIRNTEYFPADIHVIPDEDESMSSFWVRKK